MAEKKKHPTDNMLFKWARKQKEAKQREADAKADAATWSGKVIPELKRRKVKALENADGSVRVNMTTGTTTNYDVEVMEEVLSPRLFKECTKVVPDPQAIRAAVQEGRIKAKVLAKFAETTDNTPYITVTLRGDAE